MTTFKNELERKSFEIAMRALGGGVTIEHNKVIEIETALFPEVASSYPHTDDKAWRSREDFDACACPSAGL